ncbi:hypothetical protein ACH5RR_038097 [Cinchona calisaya]|uniref:Uncharacterized protein n=1 Tax=Cinchona calisaya TaxID=153742 RepID=A0ABD2Y9F5_9GENT
MRFSIFQWSNFTMKIASRQSNLGILSFESIVLSNIPFIMLLVLEEGSQPPQQHRSYHQSSEVKTNSTMNKGKSCKGCLYFSDPILTTSLRQHQPFSYPG